MTNNLALEVSPVELSEAIVLATKVAPNTLARTTSIGAPRRVPFVLGSQNDPIPRRKEIVRVEK